MRKIQEKVKQEILRDNFYKKCCLCGKTHGKIEWHHNLIYAERQSNIKETILPLCQECHEKARNSTIKEKLDFIMLNRMPDEQVESINYQQRKKYLNGKFCK